METLTKKRTSMNVKKADKEESSMMIERNPIEGSPFTVITLEENTHFGVMGEYRVTEEKNSRGEVEDELRCITWNRIIQVMMILEEIKGKDKNFDKKVKEQLTNKNK
jgi:hypothetical protein